MDLIIPNLDRVEFEQVNKFNSLIKEINLSHESPLLRGSAKYLVLITREINEYVNRKTIAGKYFYRLRRYISEKDSILKKLAHINDNFLSKYES